MEELTIHNRGQYYKWEVAHRCANSQRTRPKTRNWNRERGCG